MQRTRAETERNAVEFCLRNLAIQNLFSEKRAISIVARVETKGSVLDSAFGVRVGCAVPPSRCQLPELKIPGWRALGFPPRLWAAPMHLPGAVMGAEEAGVGGIPL